MPVGPKPPGKQYVVRYGMMRLLGVFDAGEDHAYTRGDVVVVRSDRGLHEALLAGPRGPAGPVQPLEKSEEQLIREALAATKGNRARAARMLGISRSTIFRKLKEYGLDRS